MSTTAAILVAGNFVSLVGAGLFGWRAVDLVTLYWIENIVIGLLNIPRMLLAAPEDALPVTSSERILDNARKALFFSIHYGLFCAVHALILVEFFAPGGDDDSWSALAPLLTAMMTDRWVVGGVVALAASHLFSFFVNYLGRREYQRVDASTLMGLPYRRVFVLQIFGIVGGALLQYVNENLVLIALFILVKTAIDWHVHRREHDRLSEPMPARASAE